MQLDERELERPVYHNEQVDLALFGSHLGDVDVEVADRVALELAPGRLVTLDLGQPADAVALEAAVQRRARDTRDRPLECVETVVQWQQRVASEGLLVWCREFVHFRCVHQAFHSDRQITNAASGGVTDRVCDRRGDADDADFAQTPRAHRVGEEIRMV